MKILVITHDTSDYQDQKKKMRWTRLPYHFARLGHTVRYVTKREWLFYPFIYLFFRPQVIISAGKVAGLITAWHHKFKFLKKPIFVNDLTDHPHFYKSDKRIRFIVKNHDYVTTPTKHNFDTYGCNDLIPNGSDFNPIKAKPKWDACYIGQVHEFYNVDELVKNCGKQGIKLKIVTDLPSEEVPQYIAQSRICVYTISWDSSLKMTDYAAMAKPVVAIKPNIAEKIGYPAYYCTDLIKGIKHLLTHPNLANKIGKQNRKWFLRYSGTWEQQAKKYLLTLEKYMRE